MAEKNAEVALRLRENKRRHRARQKEYTTDLERQLRELKQEGVRATIEVQIEARKVVKENKRLRELLRQAGVEDEVVEKRLREDEGERDCGRRRGYVGGKDDSVCGRGGVDGTIVNGAVAPGIIGASGEQICREGPIGIAVEDCSLYVRNGGNTQTGNGSPTESPATTNDADTTNLPSSALSSTCSSSSQKKCHHAPPAPTSTIPRQPPSLILPPCKLLTHLSTNPSADLLQLPLPPESRPPPSPHKPSNTSDEEEEPGVPCTQAYLMLTQYATSEEKLDEVAKILDEGCVRNKKGGGCRVRIDEVWRGLDGCVG
ncbi:MAG: hypothetical protein M1839_009501 [Geoglossum umbratile]|nr:MAG: hypothetical protein M1839_009501 [Geoglossum umbratile]